MLQNKLVSGGDGTNGLTGPERAGRLRVASGDPADLVAANAPHGSRMVQSAEVAARRAADKSFIFGKDFTACADLQDRRAGGIGKSHAHAQSQEQIARVANRWVRTSEASRAQRNLVRLTKELEKARDQVALVNNRW